MCSGGGAPAPATPDYAGAANATSQGSVQAAIANALLNRYNTTTPLGTQKWTPNGSISVPSIGGQAGFDLPNYTQSVDMTPEGKNLYDQQMNLSTGLLGIGNQALDQTKQSLGSPQDLQSIGDIADQSYGMQTARLDPQWQQNESMQKTQLANQGLAPGGEAYDNAMRTFNQGKNDAYSQARLSSISTMPQTYQLSTAQRMQPLTELNAIRTGAQPQMPQFQATPAAGGAQGPNYLGAAQAQYGAAQNAYNSQVGQDNAMMSGLFGIGSSVAGALPWTSIMASDRRLKSNIRRLGMHPCGLPLYAYDIGGERSVGVMADEAQILRPDAVLVGANGFLSVDYGRL